MATTFRTFSGFYPYPNPLSPELPSGFTTFSLLVFMISFPLNLPPLISVVKPVLYTSSVCASRFFSTRRFCIPGRIAGLTRTREFSLPAWFVSDFPLFFAFYTPAWLQLPVIPPPPPPYLLPVLFLPLGTEVQKITNFLASCYSLASVASSHETNPKPHNGSGSPLTHPLISVFPIKARISCLC